MRHVHYLIAFCVRVASNERHGLQFQFVIRSQYLSVQVLLDNVMAIRIVDIVVERRPAKTVETVVRIVFKRVLAALPIYHMICFILIYKKSIDLTCNFALIVIY